MDDAVIKTQYDDNDGNLYKSGDDPDYKITYKGYVASFAGSYFNAAYLNPVYTSYAPLIEEYVTAENSGYTFTSSSLFTSAVAELKAHTTERNTATTSYAAGSD